MRKIWTPKLTEILPESILRDAKLRASAEALDVELEKLSAAIREVLHLPRLDELSGRILDYLAEEFHCDFWEPLYLSDDEKKSMIRESIAWHRIKGTVAAVEKIAAMVWRDCEISEWFDYGGEPYHFRIKTRGFKSTPDGFKTFLRMIDAAKNVRSVLEKIIIELPTETLKLFAGTADAQVGTKIIGLSRPKGARINLSAGVGFGISGQRSALLSKPESPPPSLLRTGQVNIKSGTLTILCDVSDLLKRKEIRENATADLLIADVGIARPSKVKPAPKQTIIRAGQVNMKSGVVTILCDMSDVDKMPWIRENAAADLLIADVGIVRPTGLSSSIEPEPEDEIVPDGLWLRNYFDFATGRDHPVLLSDPRDDLTVGDVKAVGDYAADNAIIINSKSEGTMGIHKVSLIRGYEMAGADSTATLPATGDLRLFFSFPSGNKRKILLKNRREYITVGDIKSFGDFTTSGKVLLNARGEPSIGLTHAAVIKDFAVNSLTAATPIKF
ncbi:MAG: phage tail protein [Selenomonadaceae bacterium]|nr:phage tail protein [Selenomonadaceae bacterium]